MGRLIIDGNRVYEVDEACLQRKRKLAQMQETEGSSQTKRERVNNIQKRKQ